MNLDNEKAYSRALLAIKNKDYKNAVLQFESVNGSFGTNSEFNILYHTTRLLLAVKDELNATADSDEEITKEIVING